MNLPALIAGLGSWSFLEYMAHRFLLHGPLLQFHLPHHTEPVGKGFDWKPSIIAGVLGGFVIYSYIHAKLHEGVRLGKLKERHELHHHLPDRNFGVTTSLWDRVFKTLDTREQRTLEETIRDTSRSSSSTSRSALFSLPFRCWLQSCRYIQKAVRLSSLGPF